MSDSITVIRNDKLLRYKPISLVQKLQHKNGQFLTHCTELQLNFIVTYLQLCRQLNC